jgi:hypothetical protein
MNFSPYTKFVYSQLLVIVILKVVSLEINADIVLYHKYFPFASFMAEL